MVAALKQLEQGTTLQTTVNRILAKSVVKTLKQQSIAIEHQDIIELLNKVFDKNKQLNIFLAIDGVEKLIGKEFSAACEQLKYIRDSFRNRFEYIFGLGTAKGLSITRENYGTLSALIAQQLIIINLSSTAEEIYFSQIKRGWYNWLVSRLLPREDFVSINNVSGGYAPYIKFLLRIHFKAGAKLNMSTELISASDRLLQSLSPALIQILVGVLKGNPINTNTFNYQLLKKLGIVVNNRLFSPIFSTYLLGISSKTSL